MTSDAKLQLWDISVSSIDPVVSLDTNVDYSESAAGLIEKSNADIVKEAQAAIAHLRAASNNPLRKVAAMKNRQGGVKANNEDEKDGGEGSAASPVAKLLKNLNSGLSNRSLTSVLFGIKSPVVAVGDNRGTVIVYRIIDPVTVTHEPAVVQMAKLQRAIARQDNTLNEMKEGDDDGSAHSANNIDDHTLSFE